MKLQSGFRWFSMISLGAISALIVWAVWCLVYPYSILTVNPGSWAVINPNKHVRRGQQLLLYVDYCSFRHESPRMDIAIVQDSRVMFLTPQFPAATTVGCHKTVVPIITIPRVLAPESTTAAGDGKARLQITLRYRVNPLREITYNFVTDEFVIEP